MSYLSLYRKYRSQTFSDLIGQDHVVRTLQNAISSGRIAHSYLFTGPRGTGKTSSARLLAKCLCCEKGPTPEPCNQCDQCVSITIGNCVDVYELDAASESGVENVRETIVESTQYAPNYCRYKVFIIDEVHDLSAKAFDALLKTIEEPPEYVIFILATTEYNKVPPTIRSRCQKYEFHRASMQDLVGRLTYVAGEEGAEIEPAAITAIARMADGGYRDALTLIEQALLTSEGKITLQHVYDQLGLVSEEAVDSLLTGMADGNVAQLVDTLNEIARRGRDPRSILESLMHRLADLTRAAYGVDIGSSGDATREASLHETASRLGRENLLRLRGLVAEAHKTIRDVSLPRIWLEAELLRVSELLRSPSDKAAAAAQPTPQPRPQPTPPAPKSVAPEPEPEPARPTEKAAPAQEQTAVVTMAKEGPESQWQSVVKELAAISRTMGMKLTSTRVASAEKNVLKIAFERQFDLEWVQEGPKRHAAILEKVQHHFGVDWTLELAVHKNGGKPSIAESEAVELPAEGERLEQLAREIFKPDGTS